MKIAVKTALHGYGGYGNDGLGIATSLMEMGHDVHLLPSHVAPPLPAHIAALLTKAPDPPFDIMLHHAEPQALRLTPGERKSARKSIAWSMWEFSDLTPEATKTISEQRESGTHLDDYDLILAYDEVSKEALGKHTETPILKLIGGYDPAYWETDRMTMSQRDWAGVLKFCMVGQLHQRKDPYSAAKAFRQLTERPDVEPGSVEFHMKTNILTLHPAMELSYPGLKIHYAVWPPQQLKDFYLSCHCYVASSWGEGKNLPALEAQTTGMPVIATKIGGHAEWMGEWSYTAKHTLDEHVPGVASARVDIDDLEAQMYAVYKDRGEAKRKGELASSVIPQQMAWEKVAIRLTQLFEEQLG